MEGVSAQAKAPEEESLAGQGGPVGCGRPLSEASKDKCGVTTLGMLSSQLLPKNITSSIHPVTFNSQASLAPPTAQ